MKECICQPSVTMQHAEDCPAYDGILAGTKILAEGQTLAEIFAKSDMSISRIMEVSIQRSHRWHNGDLNQWSVLEWAGAMCGEAGECANAAKKMKRILDSIKQLNVEGRLLDTMDKAKQAVMAEAADTLLYLLPLVAAAGATPEEFERKVAEVFNRKSAEYDFPERIG